MKGLLATTDGKVEIVSLNGTWQEMADIVGGYIEVVRTPMPFENDVFVVNEDGYRLNLPLNLLGSFLYGTHVHGSPILGDMLILQEHRTFDGADFADMPDARAKREKYREIAAALVGGEG